MYKTPVGKPEREREAIQLTEHRSSLSTLYMKRKEKGAKPSPSEGKETEKKRGFLRKVMTAFVCYRSQREERGGSPKSSSERKGSLNFRRGSGNS